MEISKEKIIELATVVKQYDGWKETISKMTGKSTSYIEKIVNGNRNTTPDVLEAMVEIAKLVKIQKERIQKKINKII